MSYSRFLTLEELVNEALSESEEDDDISEVDITDIAVREPDISDEEEYESGSSSDSDQGINSDPLYLAKDGTTWRSEPYTIGILGKENILSMSPGMTKFASSRVNTIRDSFLLVFSSQITKIVINNSNKYGEHLNGSNHMEIDEELFHAYLAVLLLAGVYKSKNETLYDLFDEYYGRPIFRSIMSEKTFLYIHKVIWFDDVLTRRFQESEHKFAPIRNFWEKWSDSLSTFYNPNDCITVDDQLISFHGRCKFRQYVPSKPEMYGLKFWLLVESRTCYVWKIQPYLGKDIPEIPERNQGERMVLDLVDGLKGHNICMDNFFFFA